MIVDRLLKAGANPLVQNRMVKKGKVPSIIRFGPRSSVGLMPLILMMIVPFIRRPLISLSRKATSALQTF